MNLPGHVDHLIYAQVKWVPLLETTGSDIGGTLVEIDTTDFQKIDQAGLLKTIRAPLE
jgi:hypothetical protein